MADFTTTLAEFARRRHSRDEANRLRSSDEALDFLKRAGYCLLSPKKGIALPDLAAACDGPFLRWKDAIIKRSEIYYGRPFRRRSGFVRFDLLPALYALSPTADFAGDRFELYKRRFISAEANRIAGIVFAKGPLPTRALRRESGMAGHQHRDRFLRRLAEVESRFLIVKAGITTIEASHYSYLWEPFGSLYPQIVEQSRRMEVDVAGAQVITTYLDSIGAASIRQIATTFTLNEAFVTVMAERLSESGQIASFRDGKREYLISPELQSLL
jgi:hypothetical protein